MNDRLSVAAPTTLGVDMAFKMMESFGQTWLKPPTLEDMAGVMMAFNPFASFGFALAVGEKALEMSTRMPRASFPFMSVGSQSRR